MKILFVHAHFDDYEFTAAGAFDLWKQQLGDQLRVKVLVCTDGRAGHHARTRQETGAMRQREQAESARIGGYEAELLRLPNGKAPREACLQVSSDLLAALWKAIRDFEPDYLFCPPVPIDPLAGIHVDHVAVAEAVRRVAYMINVPHAFLDEYPVADETVSTPCRVPVIVNVYDGYMAGANQYDFAIQTNAVFERVAAMTWCHQSQIREWLPWVGRHKMSAPGSLEEWKDVLRENFTRRAQELGLTPGTFAEAFTVTAWGEVPTLEQLQRDFPAWLPDANRSENLSARLQRFRGD